MSNQTALEIVRSFCEEQGLPVPGALVGAADATTKQLRQMFTSAVDMLLQYRWQQQKLDITWTCTAAEDQGSLFTLFPGYVGLVTDTLWNRTGNRKLEGPVTDQQWQQLKSFTGGGPFPQYKIQGDHLYITPAPNGTDTFAATYITEYGYLTSLGAPAASLLVDDYRVIFPDVVMSTALELRWKGQKGEPTGDVKLELNDLVSRNIARDSAPVFSLDTPPKNLRPGIIIPAGSW